MDYSFWKLRSKSTNELIQIIRDCEELLSPMSARDYGEFTGKNKRTIQQQMKTKLKTIKFVDREYVVVNDQLNSNINTQ